MQIISEFQSFFKDNEYAMPQICGSLNQTSVRIAVTDPSGRYDIASEYIAVEPTKDPGLLSYKTNNNQKMEFHKLKVYGQDGNEIEILHDFADSVGTIYTLSEAVALDLRIVEDEQNYSLTEFHINKPIRLISGSWSFDSCLELMTAGLSLLDIRDVTDMTGMFYGCESLSSLDLTGWDTKNVTDMAGMFYGCGSLSSLDLTGWDTKNVTDMTSMFYGCANLRTMRRRDRADNKRGGGVSRKQCHYHQGIRYRTYTEKSLRQSYGARTFALCDAASAGSATAAADFQQP